MGGGFGGVFVFVWFCGLFFPFFLITLTFFQLSAREVTPAAEMVGWGTEGGPGMPLGEGWRLTFAAYREEGHKRSDRRAPRGAAVARPSASRGRRAACARGEAGRAPRPPPRGDPHPRPAQPGPASPGAASSGAALRTAHQPAPRRPAPRERPARAEAGQSRAPSGPWRSGPWTALHPCISVKLAITSGLPQTRARLSEAARLRRLSNCFLVYSAKTENYSCYSDA